MPSWVDHPTISALWQRREDALQIATATNQAAECSRRCSAKPPRLDIRIRLLCTIAALTVLGRPEQIDVHIDRALGSGCTKTEIEEVMLQMSAFGGFPAAWDALAVLRDKRDDSTAREP